MPARTRTAVAVALAAMAAASTGCGDGRDGARAPAAPSATARVRPGGSLDPALRRHPRIGRGPRFHPGPGDGPRTDCRGTLGPRFAVHVELFADRTVVLLPPGLGTGRPRRVEGAYLRTARCYGPVVALEPTGVVLVRPGARRTLGDLFADWRRPLGPRRMLSFRGPVRVYVGARRLAGDPRGLRLVPHAQITVEVGRFVRPHRRYRFPPGR